MRIDLSARGVVLNEEAADLYNRSIIQQAINDVSNAGGGSVEFDAPGIYWAASEDTIVLDNRSHVRLNGLGRCTTLKMSSRAQGHLVNHIGAQYATVSNLSLDGNREAFAKGGPGVHCLRSTKGSKGLRFKHLYIRGAAYYGIGMQWSTEWLKPDEDFVIDDVVIEDCGGWSSSGASYGDGVDIKYGYNGVLRDVIVRRAAQRGIDLRGRGHLLIGAKAVDCGSTGIALRGNSGPPGYPIGNPGKIACIGAYVASCGGDGIVLFEESTSTNEARHTVIGAIVEGCGGAGIRAAGPTNLLRATIDGNTCRSNDGGNLVVSSSYDRVKVGDNQSS